MKLYFWSTFLVTRDIRSLIVLVYFITPSPSNSKKIFQMGLGGLSSSVLRAELQIKFYLVKALKPKENLRFSKNIQTGLDILSLRMGNKVDKNGNIYYFEILHPFISSRLHYRGWTKIFLDEILINMDGLDLILDVNFIQMNALNIFVDANLSI